ncbi:MAG: bifunctional phosphoserine phosphatase/homoserine phosphotransferase ThrH [Propionibacteriaceae bacterium]|jgi:phosphoserine/homoserine phosphotransferase|nr:bifunctional phosphoserine phosphatase/homoserine phosphotransferase ThrH [Propionibacteriaceae bacterium]
MIVTCLDMEGVLVPEIWINVAERTGIEALRLTTRDVADYDELMRHRLSVLDANGISLAQIQSVIAAMGPLPGAVEFLDWLRPQSQVLVLSDTFYEFAAPLVKQLGYPTLFCHNLVVDGGEIVSYQLRQPDSKREAVLAMKQLNFKVVAAGDSYNDTRMLEVADAGILVNPPPNVVAEFDQYPVVNGFAEFKEELEVAFAHLETDSIY